MKKNTTIHTIPQSWVIGEYRVKKDNWVRVFYVDVTILQKNGYNKCCSRIALNISRNYIIAAKSAVMLMPSLMSGYCIKVL